MEWDQNSRNKLPDKNSKVLNLLLAKISVSSVRYCQKRYRHRDKPSSSSTSDSRAAGICFILLGSEFSAVSISVLVLNPSHTYSPSSFLHSTSNLDLVDSGITPEKNRVINKCYQRLSIPRYLRFSDYIWTKEWLGEWRLKSDVKILKAAISSSIAKISSLEPKAIDVSIKLGAHANACTLDSQSQQNL